MLLRWPSILTILPTAPITVEPAGLRAVEAVVPAPAASAISELSTSMTAQVGIALTAAHIAIVFACARVLTAALAAVLTTSAAATATSCPTQSKTAAVVLAVLGTLLAVAACDSTPDTSTFAAGTRSAAHNVAYRISCCSSVAINHWFLCYKFTYHML
jgi:hypothetical protein